MLQCLDALRLVSREFEMSDELWETAPLPYNELILGDFGVVARFLKTSLKSSDKCTLPLLHTTFIQIQNLLWNGISH